MKKLLIVLLAVSLLCGCTNEPTEQTTTTTTTAATTTAATTTTTSSATTTSSGKPEAPEKEEEPGEVFTPLSEADIPDVKELDRESEIQKVGLKNIILDEKTYSDYTFQLIANHIHTNEEKSDNYYVGSILVRALKGDEEIGLDGIHYNVLHVAEGDSEIKADMLESYVRVYTMKKDGNEFPVIATCYINDDGYDTTFYTIDKSGKYMWFANSLPTEVVEGGESVGMILSGDFTADSGKNTITDNKNGIVFTFDYDNLKIEAAKS